MGERWPRFSTPFVWLPTSTWYGRLIN